MPPKDPTLATERDITLFALMLNTGARVQEVLDLRIQDVRIKPPYQIRLRGKGGKIRICPIWAHTARRVRRLLASSNWPAEPDRPLFLNLRGEKLIRFGVHQLLKKRIGSCSADVASLRGRRIHPHTLRHYVWLRTISTVVALLKSGVDFATISQWLGHGGLNTTMRYARADLDLKRQALAQAFPDAVAPPPGGRLLIEGSDLAGWLRRL